MSFGWIVCKWLFCLCGIVRKCITEIGRGGAYVPARVALQVYIGNVIDFLYRAVPMCPPVSPYKGASIVKFPTWHDDTQMCVVDDMFKIVIECRGGNNAIGVVLLSAQG